MAKSSFIRVIFVFGMLSFGICRLLAAISVFPVLWMTICVDCLQATVAE
jgi:hypothetical protein